jgi:hypothetical protein
VLSVLLLLDIVLSVLLLLAIATYNTMANIRADDTMAKRRRTDNTMAKRRTDNTMAKRRRADKTMATLHIKLKIV